MHKLSRCYIFFITLSFSKCRRESLKIFCQLQHFFERAQAQDEHTHHEFTSELHIYLLARESQLISPSTNSFHL
jgi:hypothetical protein